MLATYRLPLLDARSFAVDERVSELVMLPRMWQDGSFVRGLGEVTRRPGGATRRWRHEDFYADLGRTLTFPPNGVQELNGKTDRFHLHSVRKRAWLALPGTTALFDVDLALRFDLVGKGGQAYPRNEQFDLQELFDLILQAAALPVHLRSGAPGLTHPLFMLGKPLASHYALNTSRERKGDALVKSGLMTVVVEAAGLTALLPPSYRVKWVRGSSIQMARRDLTLPGGKSLRVHVLSSEQATKGARKRIRELRIHLLRLHSVSELMGFVASMTQQHSQPIAETMGDYGFDALQAALRECVRALQDDKAIGDASPESVLRAVSSRTFGNDLELKYERMLGAMRPKIASEMRSFVERMRADEKHNVSTDCDDLTTQQTTPTIYQHINNHTHIGDIIMPNNNAEVSVGHNYRAIHAPKPEKLRVLILSASSEGDLRVGRELKRIRAAVESALHRDQIELDVRPAATTEDLLDGITKFRPHVVHFSGHSSDDLIVFEDEEDEPHKGVVVTARAFANAVQATDFPPQLVLLNSCNSASQIGALVNVVTPFAIGMADSIDDEDAIVYAARFYASIANGQSIDSAHLAGRSALELAGLYGATLPTLASADGADAKDAILVQPIDRAD